MPWIINYKEPGHIYSDSHGWYPYGYRTKDRYWDYDKSRGAFQYSRPRLPPKYFTKGWNFYKEAMDDWMRNLERENKDRYKALSRFNKREIRPKSLEIELGKDGMPLYYNYSEFLNKAKKYALRKRRKILARIEQNRQQAIRRRIEINRQKAIQARKIILARKLNKY